MTRIERNFQARPTAEQQWLLGNTWCDLCREADLGMRDVREFVECGVVFVEGSCCKCGGAVRSNVTESEYLKQPEMAGHLKVLEVLRRWDPIGVICEHNQDEYDGYAVDFINRLDHRVPVSEIVEFMRGLVLGHMGLASFDEAHARTCATELAEFWRSWKDG